MMFLEFDSSFVSRSDQLTNEPIRSKNSRPFGGGLVQGGSELSWKRASVL
jgi:hypothetical protein